MHRQTILPLLCFLVILSPSHVNLTEAAQHRSGLAAVENPFTPKASLIRYWNKRIRTNAPKPPFLLSKASPLTAVETARFAKLASERVLQTRLHDFCSAAKLFCFPELSPSLEKHDEDSNFALYNNKNFTNYGSARLGGADSFKNYSDGDNIPVDSFRRYSRDSAGHVDNFENYAPDGNVADQGFNTYGAGSTGGSALFKNYQPNVNEPNGRFASYSDDANGRSHSFTSYAADANAGVASSFTSYSKNANGAPNEFSAYGAGSNVIQSQFNGYGRTANGANDTFISYGKDTNIPQEIFKSYGDGGNAAVYGFQRYNEEANIGFDSFSSYAKDSNDEKVNFVNYMASFHLGRDNFTSYGQGAKGQRVGFKTYGSDPSFKEYAKNGVTFSRYSNTSSTSSGKSVNRWVERGKFFREAMLKEGTVMPMPDIRDKMPKRSFLPRNIVSKLPFSTSRMNEIKRIFGADNNSSMATIISDALKECERSPSAGETKQCVGSAEDMIDFATSVLGRDAAVRTTENVRGSKSQVMIGNVKGIDGGEVTKSVSCHQSLYPYLLYYCHSVPNVRVYKADLLDLNSKAKINHGVAICHLDTSAWSPGHGAFLALGSSPGRIEVCHWIFENDMTWTVAD